MFGNAPSRGGPQGTITVRQVWGGRWLASIGLRGSGHVSGLAEAPGIFNS